MVKSRASKWDKYSNEELLSLLKKEIVRIGIADSPSRTEYNKRYDKNNAPSATSYANKFGNWGDIMSMIGLDYDGKKILKDRIKDPSNFIKKKTKWRDVPDEKIIEITVEEMKKKGETRAKNYEEVRDKDITPTIRILYNRGISWKQIKNKYNEKYGV